ncbi:hypothetical protein C2W62_09615 [Candidatus Entotheonella serta]|nr:hypothetical protein C2W62_09615 [Candidatus Entotheonella serta]
MIILIILANIRAGFICLRVLNLSVVIIPTHYPNTSSGVGGNVTIAGTVDADGQPLSRADTVVVRDSLITANAQAGQGGRIDIVAQAVITEPETVFDTSAQAGGIDGEVNVEAIVTDLSGVVRPLSQRLASGFCCATTVLHACTKAW